MPSKVTLVSEATVARLKPGSVLNVVAPFIVTPSAADLAAQMKIRIVEASADEPEHTPIAAAAAETPPNLAAHIESTLLTTCATPSEIKSLCNEAVELGCAGVCVNPIYVPLAVETLTERGPAVVTVCGFPLAGSHSEVKAAEARIAEAQGATEIDMVMSVGRLKAEDFPAVRDDIAAVREALKPTTVLKVIIEAPLLSETEIVRACALCIEARADYVKTGTGFAGPATVETVALMKQAVGEKLKIKAAGGIRTRAQAEALIAAGASRIGTSKAAAVLTGGAIERRGLIPAPDSLR